MGQLRGSYREFFTKKTKGIQDNDLGKLKGTDWKIVTPLKAQIL
jgi:hypothetical protein